MAKDTEVQKLPEVPVNVAGKWRERLCTLTGEVSQTVLSAVVTTNCEKSAEAIVAWKLPQREWSEGLNNQSVEVRSTS